MAWGGLRLSSCWPLPASGPLAAIPEARLDPIQVFIQVETGTRPSSPDPCVCSSGNRDTAIVRLDIPAEPQCAALAIKRCARRQSATGTVGNEGC